MFNANYRFSILNCTPTKHDMLLPNLINRIPPFTGISILNIPVFYVFSVHNHNKYRSTQKGNK